MGDAIRPVSVTDGGKMPPPFISIIVLAAGESSRMGQPKQLLPWEGTTLLQYQIEQAGLTSAGEVIVVLGDDDATYRKLIPARLGRVSRLIVIENEDYALGKTTSVKAGVRAADARAEAVMPWASDSPRTAALLDELMAAHAEGQAPITYPWHQGIEGHPGIFSLSLRDEILAISEATRGLRGVTERDPSRVRWVEFTDPLVVVNMNTQEDYERALRLTGQSTGPRQPR